MLCKWLPSLLALFIILSIWLIFPKTSYAVILFQDNFNDGIADNWTVVRNQCGGNWEIKDGMYGISMSGNDCITETIPDDTVWNSNWNNYIIDVDMKFVSGIDKNLAWRYTDSTHWYDVHFQSPNYLMFQRLPANNWSGTYSSNDVLIPNGNTYHITVEVRGNNFKLLINNVLILDFNFLVEDDNFPTGRIALQASGGDSEVWFDNLVVTSLDEASPSPSPSPSPSSEPSPSPSPSLSPSPSPIPTPSPSKLPVVILPGFGGSWNTQAMISGGDQGIWKKTPFVKIYDNLRQTFLNAGYLEGQNYFEFYYDWRKPLDNLTDQLKNFLETTVLAGKPETTKINFIGHSMGGLVARSYGQKYGTDKINSLVTAGSPHQGAIPAWMFWSGAEIDDQWSFTWLGLQLYLQLQKSQFSSPVTAIQTLTPSLLDLAPTFDFAKKNNQIISVNNMSFANNYLTGLNNTLAPSLKNILSIVYGEISDNTIEWVNLGERSLTDKLLGKWPDGQPINNIYTNKGDLTVLSKSVIINEINSIATVSANHSDIVAKAAGIQAILNSLGLNDITPVTNTESERQNPVLFFLLHSPAQIKVISAEGLEAGYETAGSLPDTIYSEEDKLLVIQNAVSNNYQAEIIGQGNGNYGLEIGQLTDQKDQWLKIENTINAGESDFYSVNLTQAKPENPLKLTIFQLNKIKNSTNDKKLIKQIERIIKKLNELKQNQITGIISDIYRLDYQIGELDQAGKWLFDLIQETDNRWQRVAERLIARDEIKISQKYLELERKILNRKIKGENQAIGTALVLAEEYLAKAKTDFETGFYNRARAEAMVVKVLLNI